MASDLIINGLQQLSLLTGSAVGVWGLTEFVKRTPSISSISPGKVARIRSFAAVLSAIAAVFVNWTNNDLNVTGVQETIMQIADFGLIMLGATAVHETGKIDKP